METEAGEARVIWHFNFGLFVMGWPTLTWLPWYSFARRTVSSRGFNEVTGYFVISFVSCICSFLRHEFIYSRGPSQR